MVPRSFVEDLEAVKESKALTQGSPWPAPVPGQAVQGSCPGQMETQTEEGVACVVVVPVGS